MTPVTAFLLGGYLTGMPFVYYNTLASFDLAKDPQRIKTAISLLFALTWPLLLGGSLLVTIHLWVKERL